MKIPSFRLTPQPLDEEARNLKPFQWAADDVGKRHQLGGKPAFLQAFEKPVCENCKQEMTFYGQLDSINDDYVIADCGIIYVFLCFDCNEAKAIVQSG